MSCLRFLNEPHFLTHNECNKHSTNPGLLLKAVPIFMLLQKRTKKNPCLYVTAYLCSIFTVKFEEVQVMNELVCIHEILIIFQNCFWLRLHHLLLPHNMYGIFCSPHPYYHNLLKFPFAQYYQRQKCMFHYSLHLSFHCWKLNWALFNILMHLTC